MSKKNSYHDNPIQVKQKRTFLGKTEKFADNMEKKFNQRMLKAYLAGHEYFHFGYEYLFNQRLPKRHLVMQSGGTGV